MKVDINTKMVTLIGTPLGQSFAARMQNAGYEAAGLNMLYFYTQADSEHLGEIVAGIRHMNFAGFAVTKPNKVQVLRYLDELDPLCRKMGACNTVVKTPEGRLIGFALGIARGIQQGILHIMHFSQKELTTLEQTMQDAAQEAAAGKRMEGGAD